MRTTRPAAGAAEKARQQSGAADKGGECRRSRKPCLLLQQVESQERLLLIDLLALRSSQKRRRHRQCRLILLGQLFSQRGRTRRSSCRGAAVARERQALDDRVVAYLRSPKATQRDEDEAIKDARRSVAVRRRSDAQSGEELKVNALCARTPAPPRPCPPAASPAPPHVPSQHPHPSAVLADAAIVVDEEELAPAEAMDLHDMAIAQEEEALEGAAEAAAAARSRGGRGGRPCPHRSRRSHTARAALTSH